MSGVVLEEIINLIKIIGLETTQNWCAVLNQIEQACIRESICRRLIPMAGMFCPLVMGTGTFGYEISRATRITD
jgi:hypothetical protein